VTTPEPVLRADDPCLATPFAREMVRQMRALDCYGVLDGARDETVLDPLILTKARRRELPLVADPDEEVVARIEAFYNALAVMIERDCGAVATSLVHLSHEGFGRALVTVGQLVVVDRTLRDAHRFGFRELDAMEREASRALESARRLIETHPAAAGL